MLFAARAVVPLVTLLLTGAQAVDLCIFFGNCPKDKGRSRSGEEPVKVDGQWIESRTLNNGHIYLFANDVGGMDWFDAQQYCAAQGGYLAEPINREESDFLRNQATRQPADSDWWIGLRGVESCQCTPLGRRVSQPFESLFDHSKVNERTNSDLVGTTCPEGYDKICSATRDWRWVASGSKVAFTYWNGNTNEPNDNKENCVLMWKESPEFQWADFPCGSRIRPVCQKDKYDDQTDNDYYEDYEDEGGDFDHNQLRCVEPDTLYRPVKSAILDSIRNVQTYEECRYKCSNTQSCIYWAWQGHKRSRKCVLSSELKSREHSRYQLGAVSGTMLPGCPTDQTGGNGTDLGGQDDFCVEYGAIYSRGSGEKLKTVAGVSSPEGCRQECFGESRCHFFSFVNGRRNQRCSLFSGDSVRRRSSSSRRSAVSGSVAGECAMFPLDYMTDCACHSLSPLDLRIAVAAAPPGVASAPPSSISCGVNEVRRCHPPSHFGNHTQTGDLTKKGPYCVDYHTYYEDGDEIGLVEDVGSGSECRQKCLERPGCRFYTWYDRDCALKGDSQWHPVYERDAVSGTVDGPCATQYLDQLEFCECQELDYSYGDYEYTQPPEIDIRDSLGTRSPGIEVCQPNQGKRCFSRVPAST